MIAGIITIPERAKEVSLVTQELARKGIRYKLFNDVQHRGHWWNQSRMFLEFCNRGYDTEIITTTDDILFRDGWLDRVNRIIEQSDYEIISLFTNQNTAPDDELGMRRARYKMWMYDQACVWRRGILNMQFWDSLMLYAASPERTKKELGHLDCMMSAFTFDSG